MEREERGNDNGIGMGMGMGSRLAWAAYIYINICFSCCPNLHGPGTKVSKPLVCFIKLQVIFFFILFSSFAPTLVCITRITTNTSPGFYDHEIANLKRNGNQRSQGERDT